MDIATVKTVGGYLVATFLTTAGLSTIINPVARSKNFGVTARPDDKAMLAFIRPMGARDLSLGLAIGMFMFKGDQRNAGLLSLIALVIPATDAWAVWSYNGRLKEVWGHIIGGSFVGAVGAWLIG